MPDLTAASRWRLDLARRVAPAYEADPAVVAVLVGGSVARGWADRWSDIELAVVWDADPSEDARARAAARVGAGARRVYPAAGVAVAEEDYAVGGVKLHVLHLTVGAVERTLSDVVGRFDTAPAKQAVVALVHDGVVLAGAGLVAGWRERSAYPDGLVRATVAEHLAFGPRAWLEMLAERGDTLLLHELLCLVERRVLGVLLGLNRVYRPSLDPKWAGRIAARLAVAPPDLPARLAGVLRAEPAAAVAEAHRLIEETLALVEASLPDLDTAPVRARVAQARTAWDGPPPGMA